MRGWGWVLTPRGPIPPAVRSELEGRLQRQAARECPGRVKKLLLAYRGPYVKVAVVEGKPGRNGLPMIARYVEKGEVPVELCRLGYLGNVDRWTYDFYSYANDRYMPSVAASGSFEATPEQAFDSSAGAHLAAFSFPNKKRRKRAALGKPRARK